MRIDMNFPKFIKLITLIFMLGLLSWKQVLNQNQVPEPIKPNIIFIMADDLGYADLGTYGQHSIKTPNIDFLAKEGMQFTQCYSGAAVCAPARSVLMTGLHAGHTRVRGNFGIGGVKGLAGIEGRVPLKDEDLTIAELLKNEGYKTAMIGKWGLGEPETEGEPHRQGFDEFYGFLNQRRAHSYYPEYIWRDQHKIKLKNSDSNHIEYTHDLFAEEAIDFIKRNKENPFFLYVPFCIPHNNYEVPDLGIYKDETWETDAKAYAAMISRMDASVGRIMKTLKDSGIDKNTIVFFTSDNGAAKYSKQWNIFESNAPLRGIKRDAYEGGIRVPMIVRYPEIIDKGVQNDLPWYFADVMPTLVELTGGNVPDNIDGRSILPTLMGEEQDFSQRYMYWEFYEKNGWRATRFGDWKAIQNDMHNKNHKPIELYNIKIDMSESKNVASKNPEIVKKAEQIFEEAHIPSDHYIWKHLMK
jgi:arylsulfatase A-like enzyme